MEPIMNNDKPCQCNICRLQRGEITTEQTLENELKEKLENYKNSLSF